MDAAVGSMMSIRDGEAKFRSEHGRYATLRELESNGLIESTLASGSSRGYKFTLNATVNSYEARAVPTTYGSNAYSGTGSMSFYLNQSGMIRGSDKNGEEANENEPVLMRKDINP